MRPADRVRAADLPGFAAAARVQQDLAAGVSVEYYAQLEPGNLAGASDSVLGALARALHLDQAEQQHLTALARAAGPASRARRKAAAPPIRRTWRGCWS